MFYFFYLTGWNLTAKSAKVYSQSPQSWNPFNLYNLWQKILTAKAAKFILS